MANDNWNTPAWLLDLVRKMAKPVGGIYLDPCSNATSTVGALVEFRGPPNGVDGLASRWFKPDAPAFVYVNPPYSGPGPWMEKCGREAGAQTQRASESDGRTLVVECLALILGDTSTKWWHEHVSGGPRHARAICFLCGRVKFDGTKSGTPKFPSVLAYWGERFDDFRRIFRPHGWVVRLQQRR